MAVLDNQQISSSNMAERLRMVSVARRFAQTAAVADASFSVGEGEVVCLLGPSGCGKTTSLRIAAGVERPDGGEVWLGGRKVAGPGVFVSPEDRSVGLVFQDFALFPHLDVSANIGFGLHKRPQQQRAALVAEALERVGLSHLAHAFPHELSGGEQQRVALARAFAPRPQLLLMDEPFSGLDQDLRRRVREETLAVLRELRLSALIVTHDPEEAMEIADRIVLMRAGAIVQDAEPEALWRRPADKAAAAFLGEINVLKTSVAAGRAQTPWGPVGAADLDHGPAEIAFRPMDLYISSEDSAPEFEVEEAKYLGGRYLLKGRLLAKSAAPAQIRVRLALEAAPRIGDKLHLGCQSNAILIFSAET